ncbi:MAG TPA: hypothetical protein VM143_00670 [Acidimicrobiales bacterium]|nr:hypothetical protein [Acidimicrobiales bacterium]
MRRTFLIMAAAFGGLLTLLAGTGVFAALSDTARSGTNSVTSGALAPSADLQLGTATWDNTNGGYTCAAFSDNLSSPLISVQDVAPGFWGAHTAFCVRNIGSRSVSVSALSDELVDLDTACTGDEALTDATCGNQQVGELSGVLRVGYSIVDCATGNGGGNYPILRDNATTPHSLGTLAPNQTICVPTGIMYRGDTDPTAAQNAQSDGVTWRYKITGQA